MPKQKSVAELRAERAAEYAPIREKLDQLLKAPSAPVRTMGQLANLTRTELQKRNIESSFTEQTFSKLWSGVQKLDDRWLPLWASVFKVKPEQLDSGFTDRARLVETIPEGDDQPGADPVRIEAVKRVVEEFRQSEPTLLQGKQWDTLMWKLEGAARDPDVGLTLDNVRQEAVSLLRMYASKLLS